MRFVLYTCSYNYLLENNDFFLVFYESVTDGRTDGRTDRPTDRPTDGRTDITSYRDARTQLRITRKRSRKKKIFFILCNLIDK